MALDQVNNFGKSTVTTGYSNSATSIIVTDGSRFPDPASGNYNVVWWNSTDYFDPSDDPNREVVRVTAKSTNTLTVTRAQESTSATSKNSVGKEYTIILAPTAKMITDIGTSLDTKVVGPGSATDNAVVRFDLTTGKLVQNSAVTIDDTGVVAGASISGSTNTITNVPIATGISGLGANVATFLATPSSANLAAAVTDETGSGALVFGTSPTLTTPNLGTPSAATLTNATGLPLSTGVTGQLPLANGGTGANLVDPNADRLMFWDDSAGNVDWLTLGTNLSITGTTLNATGGGGGGTPGGSDTQVQYNNAGAFGGITGATTNGTALTLVAPILGTPASGTLTNCTGLPISTGVSGLGANVATFLATPSSANLAAALTDETGTGPAVFANTPTLVTPVLGVATATSINKVAITAPTTSATLTLADGSTLATSGAFSTTLTATGATNVTLPTTGTLATLVGAETLSSKTLTAPKFANAGFIADANGNEEIIFTTTAAAVNEITLANAATGGNPKIAASGGDAAVGLDIQSKSTGVIRLNNAGGDIEVGGAATASLLKFMEPSGSGTNYTAFKAGAQAGNVTYTLPPADGTSGYVLRTDGSGGLTWVAQTGGGGGVTLGLVNAINTGVVLA